MNHFFCVDLFASNSVRSGIKMHDSYFLCCAKSPFSCQDLVIEQKTFCLFTLTYSLTNKTNLLWGLLLMKLVKGSIYLLLIIALSQFWPTCWVDKITVSMYCKVFFFLWFANVSPKRRCKTLSPGQQQDWLSKVFKVFITNKILPITTEPPSSDSQSEATTRPQF